MMKAALLAGRRRIRVALVPVPRPGRGEVLVRVRSVGICRSDVHYYRTGRIGNQVIRRWPQMLGHEAAGEVAVPAHGFRAGERVAIEPAAPCGACRECRRGMGNVCSRVRFLGMPGQAGALAEYIAVPAENLVRLPRGVSFDTAAALEPVSIGLHAVRLLPGPVRVAAIVGAGPIGLSVLAALRLRRARVTVFDFLPGRLRAAKKMGAHRVVRVNLSSPMPEAAARAGKRFGYVFEAGGTASAVDLALELAGPGGTVALIGIHEGDTTPVNLHTARRKELAVRNVRRSNGELGECVRLTGRGRLKFGPMVTHRAGLAATARVFRMVEYYRNGVIKAIIRP